MASKEAKFWTLFHLSIALFTIYTVFAESLHRCGSTAKLSELMLQQVKKASASHSHGLTVSKNTRVRESMPPRPIKPRCRCSPLQQHRRKTPLLHL